MHHARFRADAPSATVLSALIATITALSLIIFVRRKPTKVLSEYDLAELEANDVSLHLSPATPAATLLVPMPGNTRPRLSFMLHPTRSLVLASLEIGFYAAMGSLFYTWGLSQTPAITAAFLVQTTTVFTPCISALAGVHISMRVWISTAVAALGTVFIFVDGIVEAETHAQAPVTQGSALGKVAVLAAAALYSMGTMRISQIASGMPFTSLVQSVRSLYAGGSIQVHAFRFWSPLQLHRCLIGKFRTYCSKQSYSHRQVAGIQVLTR